MTTSGVKTSLLKENLKSSHQVSPPPLPPKNKTLINTANCVNTPTPPLYASPQAMRSCTASSQTSNPTSVSTAQTIPNQSAPVVPLVANSKSTESGELLILYQNVKEYAANTDGCRNVGSPPPLPLKTKTLLTASENTYCRPRSLKPLPRLPTEELYQIPRVQPVTEDNYDRPRPFKPPLPPVNCSVSEPVYQQIPHYLEILPAEGSQLRLPGTYQGVQTPHYSRPAPVHPISSSDSANQASPEYQNIDELEGDDGWNEWWRSVEGHGIMSEWDPLQSLSPEMESRFLTHKAEQMRTALGFFHSLMLKRGERLRSNITELHSIADNLDKVRKRARAIGITGGTTGAVGGVAAVVGIALAPVTMGASLIATAVGAGVVVAGTGLGAGAAISGKKSNQVDRKRLERVVQEYQADITEVERCLGFILAGMVQIRRHNVTRLPSLDDDAARVARLVDMVYQENASLNTVDTFQNWMVSTGVLKGFAMWLDFFFTGDDGQKVKKGLEAKFGRKIRAMAQQLQEGLDQIYKMWDLFVLFGNRV